MTVENSRIFIFIAAACLAALVPGFIGAPPLLVWNGSPSAPIGLYLIKRDDPEFEDFVLFEPSGSIADTVYSRGYLPPDIPLIKRVAAVADDNICRENEAIFINDDYVANALLGDSLGREMPRWSGCFTLRRHEIFLLNDHEKSLDGRYFGATRKRDVIGVAIPVFVREPVE